MKYLVINGVVIPYQERKNIQSKSITIRIFPDRVMITRPSRISAERAKELLKPKHSWILESWLAEQEKKVENIIENGSKISFLGKELSLEIKSHKGKRIVLKPGEEVLVIYLPEIVEEAQIYEKIRFVLKKWYRAQAEVVFKERLKLYAGIMGVKFNDIRVKELKSKWGSCSSRGNINFNWKLVMAPLKVLDYVVIHELAHLVYLNHSTDFWHLVARYFPDYKSCKKWLKDNGQSLNF